MALLLGLAAAATYGAADFAGGLVARRVNAICVVFVSQLAGLMVLATILPFEAAGPTKEAFWWGVVAGVGGGGGVAFLYRGLAKARMSVVAPVTAVEAAIIPVLYGLLSGEKPGALALVGVVIALVAVALVAAPREEDGGTARRITGLAQPGIKDALLAGLGFGCFFIFLAKTGDGAGMWPLVGSKASSITLVALAGLVARNSLRPPAGTWGPILLAGVLDVAANVLYLLASRTGLLSLVAVATSLYPASTVLLARIVLRERMSGGQFVGLVLVVTGVGLMAAG
ncbi:MAG TPA: EamA family transporter [Actinomycetota bacterium]|jgi:drug/metabolite transporter (DMT)-like permease